MPNHLDTRTVISAKWETVDEVTESDFSFDWVQFIAGVELDDINGIANGTNSASVLNQQKLAAGLASIFQGLLSSAVNSSSSTFVTFTFQ